jgi:hypothetical protein
MLASEVQYRPVTFDCTEEHFCCPNVQANLAQLGLTYVPEHKGDLALAAEENPKTINGPQVHGTRLIRCQRGRCLAVA